MDARRARIAVPLTAETQHLIRKLAGDQRSHASIAEQALELGLRAMALPPSADNTTQLLGELAKLMSHTASFAREFGLDTTDGAKPQ